MIKAYTHVSSPYPTPCHLHTHRGDMFKKIIKQVRGELKHSYFTVIMLQPPRMSMDTKKRMYTGSWLYTESHCSTDIKAVFSGENRQTLARAFWKASCHLLKTLVASHLRTQLRTSQGHRISFIWADLPRKLCTPSSWKSLHPKSNTLLNRSLLCNTDCMARMALMPTFFIKFSGIQSDAMEMILSDFILRWLLWHKSRDGLSKGKRP